MAQSKSIRELKNSKQLKQMVDTAINDMQHMEKTLTDAGWNEHDARLWVQQQYFHNLQTFSDPVAGSIALLTELKTRIDADRQLNPESDLVSDKYVKLLEEMRKTVDLVRKTQGTTITHNVQVKDDKEMKSPEFIDVESDE